MAIDKDGNYYNVKAIQDSHEISLLNVKAIVQGQTIPIKMIIAENDTYYPVKAIDHDGRILDVKAIGEDDEIYNYDSSNYYQNLVYVFSIFSNNFGHFLLKGYFIYGLLFSTTHYLSNGKQGLIEFTPGPKCNISKGKNGHLSVVGHK